MKKSLFLVLLTVQLSNAQNAKVDSLKSLALQKTGVVKIDLLYALAYELVDVDHEASLSSARKSFAQAANIGDSLRMVKAGKITATALRRLERNDSAILIGSYCEKIAYRNGFKDEHGNILNGLGVACLYASKYDEALYYFGKYTSLYEHDKNKERVSAVQNNIGLVYYKLDDYSTALEFFNESLRTKSAINNTDIRLVNISLCYSFSGNLKEARQRIEPVLKSCVTGCDSYTYCNALFASGIIWFKSDSIDIASEIFLQSYSLAKKSNSHRLTFDNIIYLSKIYLKKGITNEAERLLLESETMLRTSRFDLEEIKLYEELCALYEVKRVYKKLSHYREKYIHLKDSVFNEKHTNNLMRLHAEAMEKENKSRLASQEQRMHLKQEIIAKQRVTNVLISLTVILLAILTYLLFRILRDRKIANIQLSRKIAERTLELEHNFKGLALAIKQRDIALDRISNDLNNSLQSMRVQCSSGIKGDVNPDSLKYFKEIETTTTRLEKSLENILTESTHSLSSTI